MPNWMSSERINLIRGFGATINLVCKEEGGFLGSIDLADKMAAGMDGAFLPHQFENQDNAEAHYLTTGPEIWWQLKYRNLKPDAFVAGVGTGGTVMGVGISSGANFIGALKIQNEMPEDAVVVTIFSDDNKKYLSTDLLKEEPVQEGFLSTNVELTGFQSFKRVCYLCCEPTECAEAQYICDNSTCELPECPARL